MKQAITILCVIALAALASVTWGQVPRTISYQGVLTDGVGGAVPDGNYNMTFRLYDTSSGGAAIWTETQNSVPVSGGIFSVTLGSVVALTATFGDTYWLTTSVAGGVETAPRRELTASPYSINAYAVQGSTNVFPADGNAGVGTTSPSAPLTVHLDTQNSTLPAIAIDNDAVGGQDVIDFMNAGIAKARIRYADGGGMHIGTIPGLDLLLHTGNTIRMSIGGATGNVLIGPAGSAVERLDVDGAIKLGTTANTNAGTMRFTGADFEGYDGATWQSLTGAGGTLPAGSAGQTLRHDGLDWTASSSMTNDGTTIGIGTPSLTGFLEVYRNGSANYVARLSSDVHGGLLRLQDEAGNKLVELGGSGNSTGGRIEINRNTTTLGFVVNGNYLGSGQPGVNIMGDSRMSSFRMDLVDDASVGLPANAISASEMLDEPGVASATSNALVNFTGGVEVILSRSITVPAGGYVFATATAQINFLHVTGTVSNGGIGVSDVSNAFPINQDVNYLVPSVYPTGNLILPATVHGLFAVASAGTYTFYFLGTEATGDMSLNDMQFTLLYVPTAYGTVTPTLAAGPTLSDEQSPRRAAMTPGEIAAERAESEAFNAARIRRELNAMRARIEQMERELADERG